MKIPIRFNYDQGAIEPVSVNTTVSVNIDNNGRCCSRNLIWNYSATRLIVYSLPNPPPPHSIDGDSAMLTVILIPTNKEVPCFWSLRCYIFPQLINVKMSTFMSRINFVLI